MGRPISSPSSPAASTPTAMPNQREPPLSTTIAAPYAPTSAEATWPKFNSPA